MSKYIFANSKAQLVHLKDDYIEHLSRTDINEANAIMYKETRPFLAFELIDPNHVLMIPVRSHIGKQNGNNTQQYSVFVNEPAANPISVTKRNQNVDVSVAHIMTKPDFIKYSYEYLPDERAMLYEKPLPSDYLTMDSTTYAKLTNQDFQDNVIDSFSEYVKDYTRQFERIDAYSDYYKQVEPIKNVALAYHQELLGTGLKPIGHRKPIGTQEFSELDSDLVFTTPVENHYFGLVKKENGDLTANQLKDRLLIPQQADRRSKFKENKLKRQAETKKIKTRRYNLAPSQPVPKIKPVLKHKKVQDTFEEMEL